jgi:hypothetical protein
MIENVPYPQFVFYALSAIAVLGLSMAFIAECIYGGDTGKGRTDGLFEDRPATDWRSMAMEEETLED